MRGNGSVNVNENEKESASVSGNESVNAKGKRNGSENVIENESCESENGNGNGNCGNENESVNFAIEIVNGTICGNGIVIVIGCTPAVAAAPVASTILSVQSTRTMPEGTGKYLRSILS